MNKKTNKVQLEILRSQSEERKGATQLEQIKKNYIKEIKSLKKEDMFPIPKKLTLWQKIKILVLGN
jgi:hypothetical protein